MKADLPSFSRQVQCVPPPPARKFYRFSFSTCCGGTLGEALRDAVFSEDDFVSMQDSGSDLAAPSGPGDLTALHPEGGSPAQRGKSGTQRKWRMGAGPDPPS